MSKKQYIHYSVPKILDEAISKGSGVTGLVNVAFYDGEVKPGKSSDELSDLDKSKIVFDSATGKVRTRFNGQDEWFRPFHECPDCHGKLVLKKNFITRNRRKASAWIYVCEGFEDGACKSFFPANNTGKLTYKPVNAETRNARRLTNEMFQRLWEEAPDILSWAGNPAEMDAVVNAAKARAYRYLAAKMKEEGFDEGNIPKMDIPTLRVAYRVCRDADLEEVMQI